MTKEFEDKGNNYSIRENVNIGEVRVADEVVAIIAGLAATEVEGVESMAGNITNELVAKLGMKNLSKGVKVTVEDKTVTVDLALNIRFGYEIPKVSKKVQEKVKSAINEIENVRAYFIQNKKDNTYDNIKLVHDYLVESIEYDQTVSQTNIYDIYGALVKKESVCEGYAKSFKYLMDSVEIPCVIVAGEGTNSEGSTENHAWNYVELDGKWYAIDCTWDDPIIIGGGKLSNSAKYKYFLKGESEFNQSHFPSGQFTENGKVFEYPPLSINNYR